MASREAARWLALFLIVIGSWFAYNRYVECDSAFGITRAMNGEPVTVRANVVSISGGKGHIFPILQDPSNQKTIKGVLFRNDDNPEENAKQKALIETARREGSLLTIDGEVCIYNDALEIIIRKAY